MSEEKSEEKSVVERILEQGSTIKIAVQDYLDMKKVSDNRLETTWKQALQIEEQIKRLKKARAQRDEAKLELMSIQDDMRHYKKTWDLLKEIHELLNRGNMVQDAEILIWMAKANAGLKYIRCDDGMPDRR